MIKFKVLTGILMLTLCLSSCGNKDVRQMNQEIKRIEQGTNEMIQNIKNLETKLRETQGEAKVQIEKQIKSIETTIEKKKMIKEQLDKEMSKAEEENINEK